MSRDAALAALSDRAAEWDVLVIGGGATGLGTAVESAARGYRTLLLEQSDFAKGTSSRSTKLVHGGVRYLRQGDVGLVLEALRERGRLVLNAPHLVHDLSFVVPTYDWWEGPFYGIGLKLYDRLAGSLGLGRSRMLSREETFEHIPTVEPDGLDGGVIYHDAQFDDARLAIALALTLEDLGGTALNYMRVEGLRKRNGLVCGVRARDEETGEEHEVAARVVVNATGVFGDAVRRLDEPHAKPLMMPSQGVHLVLDRSFQPGPSAILVPHTDDGRVLFAVPWHDRILIGTTDTPVREPALEPRPLPEEVDYLLSHAARYLTKDPAPEDVLSTFAGLRPLVAPNGSGETAAISRDHVVLISASGLVTVTGGKWTTYRQMGEDTLDRAATVGGLPGRPSRTADMALHGCPAAPGAAASPAAESGAATPGGDALAVYGSDAPAVREVLAERPEWSAPLHEALPYKLGEAAWAVRHEMARTVEDVLARRTRALLLDARASMEAAPAVAETVAEELGRGEDWARAQVAEYRTLARGYLPEAR